MKKLYVLDDDLQYARLLAGVAKRSGWDVQVEDDPHKFLAREFEEAVLVLDLVMPQMDGIEVIRELGNKTQKLSLILVSGFDTRVLHSAQQLAEAHNVKVLAGMTKPFSLSEFVDVLKQHEATEATQKTSKSSDKEPISVEELRTAIYEHQLVPHFQPQVEIKTKRLHGAEVLIRWQHPTRGLLYPGDFIELAEKNNLIGALTEEVINLAIHQAACWKQDGKEIALSINVSAENVISLQLPEKLRALLQENAIEPDHITMELTESAVMGELTSSLDVLNRLRMKGFSLSIDDFGTGYSSFSHLYQAPFNELKIDQSFVSYMHEHKEAMVIVKICVMLAKMLDMKIVAEGIETQAIWDELQIMDCDIAQGYFIAKPMPAQQFDHWLDDWESTHNT